MRPTAALLAACALLAAARAAPADDAPPAVPTLALDQSTLAVGMGAEVHSAQPIPLDWAVTAESAATPLVSGEVALFVTNGSRFRDRIDFLSLGGGVALHPLAPLLAGPPCSFGGRIAASLAADVGLSFETTHVGPQFHYEPGAWLGVHLDVPLTRDGSVQARLMLRHFWAPAVSFPAPMGGTETYGPPPLETFAGLAFRL